MSDFDEADSENREKKKEKKIDFANWRFEGFRENKISRTEASSIFTFREKV